MHSNCLGKNTDNNLEVRRIVSSKEGRRKRERVERASKREREREDGEEEAEKEAIMLLCSGIVQECFSAPDQLPVFN